jgi:Icc-related predicted phosphoesterase
MKICALSDLHGFLIDDIEECDLVLICGDSVALTHQRGFTKAFKWYKNKFKPWAESLPCKKVLFIAGNHDPLEGHEDKMRELFPRTDKVTYLCHELYEYEGLKIFGTPYCHQFGNWPFMHDDETLDKYFSEIPENIDILLTHDVPYDMSDVLLQQTEWSTSKHIGSIPLRKAIDRVLPSLHFSGHLHSCDHALIPFTINGKIIQHANVSIVDEYYNPIYQPLYYQSLYGKNL